jgi:phosphoribosylglycinamide formyltransferase 1
MPQKTLNLGIIGSTRGTDMLAIIEAIRIQTLPNVKISVVVSNKKNSGILEKAEVENLPAIFLTKKLPTGLKSKENYDQQLVEIMKNYSVDLVVLIGYMKILTPVFVNSFEGRIINVHPSLLPKFAGGMDGDVHQAVIGAGELETGCTVHIVDNGVDTGRILLQKTCSVESGETPESLKQKVQKLEGEALVEVIKNFSLQL